MTSLRYLLDIFSYLESKHLTINWNEDKLYFFSLKDTFCLDKIYAPNVPFSKYFVSNQTWANRDSYLFQCIETSNFILFQKWKPNE